MPLVDVVRGVNIYGPRILVCVCGHEPTWHKKLNRACGKCNCGGFKTGFVGDTRKR